MGRYKFHVIFWKWYLAKAISPRGALPLERFNELLSQESDRIRYWLPLKEAFALSQAHRLSDVSLFRQTGYSYDLHKILQPFPAWMRFCSKFGDDFKGRFTPSAPTFVKARKINSGDPNWVLLPLDTYRHFQFPDDHIQWAQKKDMAVWRGAAHREKRKIFVRGAAGASRADVGTVTETQGMAPYIRPRMSIIDQQQFKFIISLEGNDVATGLKWIMNSNSLCMMPKPTFETWLMEGTLRPGVHYAEIAPDGSDLDDMISFYLDNPLKAQEIIHHAKQYLQPFKNPTWNLELAQTVAYRYFQLSGQLPEHAPAQRK